ncbi:MAG: hypothetical protein WBX25_08040 [Rhodomicrobium sp.]
MVLGRRVLEFLSSRINKPIPLRPSFWDGGVFDFHPAPAVTVTLTTPRTARLIIGGNVDGLCAGSPQYQPAREDCDLPYG